jgi:hypothetical protein
MFEKTKPIVSRCVLRDASCVWIPACAGMTNMESLNGGKFFTDLKKQSQSFDFAQSLP